MTQTTTSTMTTAELNSALSIAPDTSKNITDVLKAAGISDNGVGIRIRRQKRKTTVIVRMATKGKAFINKSIPLTEDPKKQLELAVKIRDFSSVALRAPTKSKIKLFELGYPTDIDARGINYLKSDDIWQVKWDVNMAQRELRPEIKRVRFETAEEAIEFRDSVLGEFIKLNPYNPKLKFQKFGAGRKMIGVRNFQGIKIKEVKDGVSVYINYHTRTPEGLKLVQVTLGKTSTKLGFFKLVEEGLSIKRAKVQETGAIEPIIEIDFEQLLADLNTTLA